MVKKCCSQSHVLVLVLLLCLLPCLTQSSPFSVTGRRLVNTYFPDGGIRAGPSKSGSGGGRNPVAATP